MKRLTALTLALLLVSPSTVEARTFFAQVQDQEVEEIVEADKSKRLTREEIRKARKARRAEARAARRKRVRHTDLRTVQERNTQAAHGGFRRYMRGRRIKKELRTLEAREWSGERRKHSAAELRRNLRVQTSVQYDARRRKDMRGLMDALSSYFYDHDGVFPVSIPGGEAGEICKQNAGSCSDLLNLTTDLIPAHISAIPVDPEVSVESNGTGYFVVETGSGRAILSAPKGKSGSGISMELKVLQ